jgi:HSP20 family molecular chaperone IbpA
MNTTKFKSLFPTILMAEDLQDSLLDQFAVKPYQRSFGYESKTSEKGWELRIPLPGATKNDLTVEVKEANQLIIEASGESVWEKKQTKKFKLPVESDADNIEGEMKDGILTLSIPKKKSFLEKSVKIK